MKRKRREPPPETAVLAPSLTLADRPQITLLVLMSVVWLCIRLYASSRIGFGDSEALYACYALHPQPAYLDHPGAIGLFARAVGGGAAPSPFVAHAWTAALSTLVPWLCALAARALGSSWRAAAGAGLVLTAIPETAIGLFAMTPDLLLAIAWLATIALAAAGLRRAPESPAAILCLISAGLLSGIAMSAKVTAIALFLALIATYASAPARRHARTIWPWVGLAAGLVVVLPVALFEARTGFPMLRHRFVDTQAGAGFSLRNLGALLGGQLLYISPVFAVAAFFVARDLVRERARDVASRLLFLSFVVPLGVLVPLCLWSRVAEPHWIAPALLALPLHAARRFIGDGTPAATEGSADVPFARRPTPQRGRHLEEGGVEVVGARLVRAAFYTGFGLSAAVSLWVLVPALVALAPKGYDPRFDLANELYGWPIAIEAAADVARGEISPADPEGSDLVVVGPHWTVCAQLHAGLPRTVRVGCASPGGDDFDTWMPRAEWQQAERILFVTDNRFDVDPNTIAPNRIHAGQNRITVLRGGKTARVFSLTLLERRGQAGL